MSAVPQPPRVVVGAAILAEGRLLAAQRRHPPELAGYWELPGGKVEAGETDEEALLRECREELGCDLALGRRVGGDWPIGAGRVLRVWLAHVVRGRPAAGADHQALRWLEPGAWAELPWLPADLPVIDAAASVAATVDQGVAWRYRA